MLDGGLLIAYVQAVRLIPNFCLGNALILTGHDDRRSVWRSAFLRGRFILAAASLCFNCIVRRRISRRVALCFVALSAVVRGVSYACAYGVIGGEDLGDYRTIALPLEIAAGLCALPLAQLANEYVLRSEESVARYRICGWLAAVGLGLLVLLFPQTCATPAVAITALLLPSLGLVALLARRSASPSAVASAAVATTTKGVRGAEEKDATTFDVGGARALALILYSTLIGTNAEALLDMATRSAYVGALRQGHPALAIANQTAVLMAMAAALISELFLIRRATAAAKRRGGDGGIATAARAAMQRAVPYINGWACIQLVRAAGLRYLSAAHGGASAVVLMWIFVALDKYSGPLGGAAVESAILRFLRSSSGAETATQQASKVDSTFRVRSSLVLATCTVVGSLRRPLAEVLLTLVGDTRGAEWRLELIVVVLAAITAIFVQRASSVVVQRPSARPVMRLKQR